MGKTYKMNHFENIININQEMIMLDEAELYNEIYNFLRDNFKVDYIKIYIKKNGVNINIFDNSKDNIHFFYTQKLKLSSGLQLIFGLIFSNVQNLEAVRSDSKKIDLLLKNFSNIIYIKFLEAKIDNALIVDDLTKCYSRTYLNYCTPPIFSLAQREGNTIAFLVVEIDHFKAVLDEFNYDIGDKVLLTLSKVLKSHIRDSDFVIRLGNDTFLVILQNIAEEDNALLVANKLIEAFKKEKVVVNEETGQVLMKTISIGISFYPKDGLDLDTIIRKSDIAVREAKNNSRSSIFVFSEDETSKIELF